MSLHSKAVEYYFGLNKVYLENPLSPWIAVLAKLQPNGEEVVDDNE